MNGVFYIGATGLHAQQRALDVVANNIANINTPGFKRSEVRFSELVAPRAEDLQSGLDASSSPLGAMVQGSPRIFTQGDLKPTGRPMDIAIRGEGFLELLGPGGQTLLWRGGALSVGADGLLGANGMPLKAMISPPADATSISIGQDGLVRATVDGEAQSRELGQIDVVRPRDMDGLSGLDGGLYEVADEGDLTAMVPGEDGAGVLVQGALEASNVQLSDEMVTLLLMQRSYAANAQIVQAGDQLMAIANSLKR